MESPKGTSDDDLLGEVSFKHEIKSAAQSKKPRQRKKPTVRKPVVGLAEKEEVVEEHGTVEQERKPVVVKKSVKQKKLDEPTANMLNQSNQSVQKHTLSALHSQKEADYRDIQAGYSLLEKRYLQLQQSYIELKQLGIRDAAENFTQYKESIAARNSGTHDMIRIQI